MAEHSHTSASNSLYQGQDYNPLARLLVESLPALRPRIPLPGATNNVSSSQPGFALLYNLSKHLSSGVPLEAVELSVHRQQMLQDDSNGDNESRSLIFLRGYPQYAELLEIGCQYEVDPEAFYRHLSFLSSNRALERQKPFTLPSFQRPIFQLSLTSVGHYDTLADTPVAAVRLRVAGEMKNYWDKIKIPGTWKPGASIVRTMHIYNQSVFSFEQQVTVFVSKEDEKNNWTSKSTARQNGKSLTLLSSIGLARHRGRSTSDSIWSMAWFNMVQAN